MGKRFLLRRLARRHEGLYHMALEEEPAPALQRFGGNVAERHGFGRGRLRFEDWNEALRTAISGPGAQSRDAVDLIVLDELPYLLAYPMGRDIPSVLQALVDESRDDPRAPARRVILCGSALSVMTDLLSGQRALRGRAEIELILRPFGFRTVAEYYRVRDPQVAFRLYATLGGTPGYRDLLGDASPQSEEELDALLLATIANPSHALFGEPAALLREDPRIGNRAPCSSVLAAIAAGATTPAKVAAAIGRDQGGLAYPLHVLQSAGFIRKEVDVLLQRRPVLRLADPIVALHQLVIAPRLAAFEDRRPEAAWRDARPTVRAQLLGPAFEALAREWTVRHAAEATLGGPVGEVGTTVVNDRSGRTRFEVDVVALAAGQRRQQRAATVRVLGEAKDSARPRSTNDLARLERVRSLLVARGVDAAGARLLLFARSGFDRALRAAADRRHDVKLVDLERISYGS
jgi:uncharacterized protein